MCKCSECDQYKCLTCRLLSVDCLPISRPFVPRSEWMNSTSQFGVGYVTEGGGERADVQYTDMSG